MCQALVQAPGDTVERVTHQACASRELQFWCLDRVSGSGMFYEGNKVEKWDRE